MGKLEGKQNAAVKVEVRCRLARGEREGHLIGRFIGIFLVLTAASLRSLWGGATDGTGVLSCDIIFGELPDMGPKVGWGIATFEPLCGLFAITLVARDWYD